MSNDGSNAFEKNADAGQPTTARDEFEAGFYYTEKISPKETISELTQEIDRLTTHLYDKPILLPQNCIERAVAKLKLAHMGGEQSLWLSAAGDLRYAKIANDRLSETYIPHVDWSNTTYYDHFIKDPMDGIDISNESDSKRSFRHHEVMWALSHATVESSHPILDTIDQLPENSIEWRRSLYSLVEQMATPNTRANPEPTRAELARQIFEQATGYENNNPQKRKNMLGLALDSSMQAIETFDDEPKEDLGEAYLTAARSIFDLTAEPDSFRPQLNERQAREFRTRAYEMAVYWIDQASAAFKESIDMPIGDITHDRLPEIRQNIQKAENISSRIREIDWFRNIFEDNLRQSIESSQASRRIIGEKAVILALRTKLTQPAPQGVVPDVVAA